ncbi:MAG: hypothetical protein KBF45_02610 [Cyclobacteriaceae bacterium]|jgi:hypothetical protein|nr:hypothetical protein [Cyclobacteriaceae bacterium]
MKANFKPEFKYSEAEHIEKRRAWKGFSSQGQFQNYFQIELWPTIE